MYPIQLDRESLDYMKFKWVAERMTKLASNCVFKVEDCYLDFGANMMQTTIIAYPRNSNYNFQAINPRQWEIIYLQDVISHMEEIAEDIIENLAESKLVTKK